MAQDDAQPARTDAQPPSPPPPPRTSRTKGFLAGIVGGVVGALGSVYALQFPEVRQNLPLPEQAALIVNPEAVARISALEQELAQVRNFAREADTRQSIGALSSRVDTLSGEVTAAATAAQLSELRGELSRLATPEGEAELALLIERLEAELTELGETAARASALATVEAAVQGFERRVGDLESQAPALRSDVDELAMELATARDNAAAIAATLAAAELALADRTASLAGRIDATARDVGEVQTAIGAAGARIEGLTEQVAALTERATAATAAAAEAGAKAEASEQSLSTLAAELEGRMAGVVVELGMLEASVDERVAGLATEAQAAVASAEAARTAVDLSMQRVRAAGHLSAAARELERALASGSELTTAADELAAVDPSALASGQAARTAELSAVVDANVAGVASLPALRASLSNLRPAVEAAVTPPSDGSVGGTLLDTLQLRPTGRTGAAGATLDEMRLRLDDDDVAGAIEAAAALPDAGRAVLTDWLASARAYAAIDYARQALLDLGRDVTASAAGAS